MPGILKLISAEFVRLIIFANVIAWPVAYYIMNSWLKDFAYRISINVWLFMAAGIITLCIALLTVSAHAVKAATANPVESLRYE